MFKFVVFELRDNALIIPFGDSSRGSINVYSFLRETSAAIREKVSKREHLRDKDRTHGRSFRKDNLFLTPSMYTCLSLEHR